MRALALRVGLSPPLATFLRETTGSALPLAPRAAKIVWLRTALRPSAAEMDAMAFALAIVASCDGCTATIAFDCQSAAGIAMLRCTAHMLPSHAKGFAALQTIAAQRRNTVQFRHVSAHTGDPFNECSDPSNHGKSARPLRICSCLQQWHPASHVVDGQ